MLDASEDDPDLTHKTSMDFLVDKIQYVCLPEGIRYSAGNWDEGGMSSVHSDNNAY